MTTPTAPTTPETPLPGVYVWRDALPAEMCAALVDLVAGRQIFETDQVLADRLGARFAAYMPHAPVSLKFGPYVTLVASNQPIDWHVDRVAPDPHIEPKITHKLLVYLNDVPNGGTLFRRSDPVKIANSKGTIVLFARHLDHRSEPHAAEHVKVTLGLRVIR